MNRLFVAYKPSSIGSNGFLSKLKKKYGVKKAGFSGTLDPFAKGVLVIGFGSYTKLFRFLAKTPKLYRATLWLGAKSDSLDIELIDQIDETRELDGLLVEEALASLCGELEYTPPIYSAKQVDGKRAYDIARAGGSVELKKIKSTIYETKLINYSHPFVTFEALVSEGSYIRSLGLILANRLGVSHGSLSALERLREGCFVYENEKELVVRDSLELRQNCYNGDWENLKYGRVLVVSDFSVQEDGQYWVDGGTFISIVKIEDGAVTYELGRIEC